MSVKSSKNARFNKIYRTPPTPEPDEYLQREKAFTLDSIACSSISTDYSKANPKLGPVVPPYNSQKDKHVNQYFAFHGVNKTLEKTEQVNMYFFYLPVYLVVAFDKG